MVLNLGTYQSGLNVQAAVGQGRRPGAGVRAFTPRTDVKGFQPTYHWDRIKSSGKKSPRSVNPLVVTQYYLLRRGAGGLTKCAVLF